MGIPHRATRLIVVLTVAAVLTAGSLTAGALTGLLPSNPETGSAGACHASPMLSPSAIQPAYRERGGPHAFLLGDSADFQTGVSYQVWWRVDPAPAQDAGVAMSAQSPPAGVVSSQPVLRGDAAIRYPVAASDFQSPMPEDLNGAYYLGIIRLPTPGCWQVSLAVEGTTAGNVTLEVVEPSEDTGPSPSAPPAPQPTLAASPKFPASCDVTLPNPAFAAPSPYPAHPFSNRKEWYGSEALWTFLDPNGEVWKGLPLGAGGLAQKTSGSVPA